MSLRITVGRERYSIEPLEGEPLAAAASRAGLTLNSRCGGNGICHGCTVYLESGRFAVEERTVEAGDSEEATVLACRTRLLDGAGAIRFPHSSVVETRAQIDDLFDAAVIERVARARTFAHGNGEDRSEPVYGVAVDIGTTTVVAVLVDLHAREVVQKASMYNQQIGRADDVASRISYATTPAKLSELQRLLVERTVSPLIAALCARAGISGEQVRAVVASGNTVMTHLFYGLSPEGIGSIPFEPVTNIYPSLPAAEMNLPIHRDAPVETVPSVAGYIGGDLTAGMYVTHLDRRSETTLLVDIGTNGEMILWHDGRLTACATAAGPAFEGAGVSCGCRAADGAIERVRFDERLNLDYSIIGEARAPKGICGSGIVDFIAEGLRAGIINDRGRYDPATLRAIGRYHAAGDPDRPSHAFLLASAEESVTGEPVYVSELDISQLLKAKAATFSGMRTLLEHVGLRFDALSTICLAGGFARHLNLDNAVEIGLMPEVPLDRFEIVGNGSLAGAVLGLLDADAMPAYRALIEKPKVIELNLEPAFESNFIDSLALPNMDESLFPECIRRRTAARQEVSR